MAKHYHITDAERKRIESSVLTPASLKTAKALLHRRVLLTGERVYLYDTDPRKLRTALDVLDHRVGWAFTNDGRNVIYSTKTGRWSYLNADGSHRK